MIWVYFNMVYINYRSTLNYAVVSTLLVRIICLSLTTQKTKHSFLRCILLNYIVKVNTYVYCATSHETYKTEGNMKRDFSFYIAYKYW